MILCLHFFCHQALRHLYCKTNTQCIQMFGCYRSCRRPEKKPFAYITVCCIKVTTEISAYLFFMWYF